MLTVQLKSSGSERTFAEIGLRIETWGTRILFSKIEESNEKLQRFVTSGPKILEKPHFITQKKADCLKKGITSWESVSKVAFKKLQSISE